MKSPLREAGQIDFCPSCSIEFIVPGREKKEAIRQELDLPRPKQIEVSKLKGESEIAVLRAQLSRQTQSSKVEQLQASIRFEKELESQLLERLLELSTQDKSRKLDMLIALGSELTKNINSVVAEDWPEAAKRKAIEKLSQIKQSACREILNNV